MGMGNLQAYAHKAKYTGNHIWQFVIVSIIITHTFLCKSRVMFFEPLALIVVLWKYTEQLA